MPSKTILDAFLARVLSGDHAGAIEDYYSEDSSMQENLDPPRVGRDANVTRERATLARHKEVRTWIVGEPYVNGDDVIIEWAFEFVRPDGSVMRIEEIARQLWRGDKIVRERFYYDPKQLGR